MDLGHSSSEGEHVEVVDDVASGLLVMDAFASLCGFDAPFAHVSSDADSLCGCW